MSGVDEGSILCSQNTLERPSITLTFGRWNETDVRVLRVACECVPCNAAFFAVFAFAADEVGAGFEAAAEGRREFHMCYIEPLIVIPFFPPFADFVVAIAN